VLINLGGTFNHSLLSPPVLAVNIFVPFIDLLNEKDDIISQAISEKKRLMEEALHIPPNEFDTVAEVSKPPSTPPLLEKSQTPHRMSAYRQLSAD